MNFNNNFFLLLLCLFRWSFGPISSPSKRDAEAAEAAGAAGAAAAAAASSAACG